MLFFFAEAYCAPFSAPPQTDESGDAHPQVNLSSGFALSFSDSNLLRDSVMVKLASISLAATLGLLAFGLNRPASAGVVVGIGLPVPAVTISAGIPAAVPAPAIYPYVPLGGAYYPYWRYRYPYYLGYHYGWHRGYGWHPGFGWHRGYIRGRVGRGWYR